jgi:integrase
MANRTNSLVVLARIDNLGWRRGAIITSKNGRVKDGFMTYNGVEYPTNNAKYQIRSYVGSKAIYTTVGTDLEKAEATLGRLNATNTLQSAQAKLGIIPEKRDESTIETYRTQYLAEYARGKYSKVRLYTVVVDTFCAQLAAAGKIMPAQIEQADVVALDDHWKATGLAQYTCSTRYTTVRSFLSFCGLDPNKLIKTAKHKELKFKARPRPEEYTNEEVEKLIVASSDRHGLVWDCYFKLGLRDEELAFLEWRDIDWTGKTVTIRFKPKGSFAYAPELEWGPKDKDERVVPIPGSLLVKLVEWRASNPKTRFVVGTKNDRPDIKFLKALKSDWRRAGLNCGECPGCIKKQECGNAYLHKFRSSYLTRMFAFCSPRDVMALAGHSEIETTMHYLCESKGVVRQNAVNAAFA